MEHSSGPSSWTGARACVKSALPVGPARMAFAEAALTAYEISAAVDDDTVETESLAKESKGLSYVLGVRQRKDLQ